MNNLVSMVEDFASILVTLILAYVAYKIALLVDALTSKVKKEKDSK